MRADIITLLGDNRAEEAMSAVKKALRNKNEKVRLAAVAAAGKIGQEEVLPELLRVMQKGDERDAVAVKNALLIMKGNSIIDQVAEALPKMPAVAQAELLSVMGARAAHSRINNVLSYADDKDPRIRMAALSALGQMARKEDLPQLYVLLDRVSQPEELEAMQKAIIVAVKEYESQQQQAQLVLQQMEKAPANKKSAYFNVLAGIGGQEASNTVAQAFSNGNEATRIAAVNALSQWLDVSAAKALYCIAKEPANGAYLDEALRGYIRTVSTSKYPADQKVLLLRDGMEVAQTPEQKKLILREVEKNKTFPALVFAGR